MLIAMTLHSTFALKLFSTHWARKSSHALPCEHHNGTSRRTPFHTFHTNNWIFQRGIGSVDSVRAKKKTRRDVAASHGCSETFSCTLNVERFSIGVLQTSWLLLLRIRPTNNSIFFSQVYFCTAFFFHIINAGNDWWQTWTIARWRVLTVWCCQLLRIPQHKCDATSVPRILVTIRWVFFICSTKRNVTHSYRGKQSSYTQNREIAISSEPSRFG